MQGKQENARRAFFENLKKGVQFEDLGLHGMIIAKRILKKEYGRVRNRSAWHRMGDPSRLLHTR
jgi:hypothetical protein